MQSIEQRINNLVDQWQDYCLPDKTQICKPKVQQFLTQIDQLLEKYQNKKQKSKLYYLRGKVMDLLPVYQKSAEQFLNKSIKLNPTNGDCWNVLAHILFKKTDYDGASKAIHMAIQTKGKNKVSLRYQSVLMRTQGSKFIDKQELDEDRRKNIEQSLKVIKQALVLDIKDWATWYFLGNAYLSNFVANFKKVDELQNAIKAYNQAEKYLKIKYPDLYLNRANVEMHLQDYQKALIDLKLADQIDNSLGAKSSIESIRNRMQYTKISFQRMKQLKANKIQQMMKTIPNSVNKKDKPENQPEITSIKNLKVRYNPGKMLSAKIISKLTKQVDIPTSFLAMDSEGKFLCISLYNVNNNVIEQKIKKDSLVNVSDPEVKNIQFEGFSYDAVQVFQITKIWVDKVRLTSKQFNPNVVYNETFQK